MSPPGNKKPLPVQGRERGSRGATLLKQYAPLIPGTAVQAIPCAMITGRLPAQATQIRLHNSLAHSTPTHVPPSQLLAALWTRLWCILFQINVF